MLLVRRRLPPLLLLHGIGQCIEDWAQNLPALAQKHRVLVPDLVGFGRSEKPADAPYTLSFFAGFVRDFLDAVGWLFRLLTVRGVGERFLRRSTRPGNARILRPF